MKRLMASTLVLAAALPLAADERPPAPVEVASAELVEVSAGRVFVGDVHPARESITGSEFAGLVVEYMVTEGDRVQADQPLAKLHSDLLDARIAAAQAELENRKTILLELKNGSRPEDIAEAKARELRAYAEVESRKWKLKASERLRENKAISEDELRDARIASQTAQALYDALKAIRERIEKGPREEKVKQAAAEVTEQEAEIRRLEEEKRRYTIRAPFDGYVVKEGTEVGQWVRAGDPVAHIVALDEVDVVIPVLEDYIGAVKVGMDVKVSIGAVTGRVFPGKIHRIVPRADTVARTFPVKVRVANESNGDHVLIKAGMFASVSLPVGTKVEALLVPKDALVLAGGRSMVYVLDTASSTVKPVPVELGVALGSRIQVKGELVAGLQVVVRGNERLRPGQKVQVIKGP